MNIQAGEKIARRLKELKKTQEWLAERVGVSINSVSKWTRTGKIAAKNLPAVSRELGIPLDDLVMGRESPYIAPLESRLERLDSTEARMLALFRECPPPVREVVISQLELHAMAARAPQPGPESLRFRNKP